MERFVQEAEASRGKTTITGQNLNPTILKDLTRSAAASGDNATASRKMQEDAQPINRQLQGNAVNFFHENVEEEADRRTLLARIRRIYHQIRGNDEEDES
jgi:hypothetical protein